MRSKRMPIISMTFKVLGNERRLWKADECIEKKKKNDSKADEKNQSIVYIFNRTYFKH